MSGERLRRLREERGLTQAELAQRSGVSRQLVGAVETGRHLPRVDAALALATSLDVDVAALFDHEEHAGDVLSGEPPAEGQLIRLGRVGERMVSAPASAGSTGWDAADAVYEEGSVRPLTSMRPGVVMAGCEPGLRVLEQSLRERGRGALAVDCSTAAAMRALDRGRAHIAVVHGDSDTIAETDTATIRFRLCAWRVGLAGPAGAGTGWASAALRGEMPVAQREPGARVQLAFERAAVTGVEGPRVRGHLEAALVAASGVPAVTIEPAALAVGAEFHPLETHAAELWVARHQATDPGVEAVLGEVTGERFQRRLSGVGGYDLSGIGRRAA